MKTQCVILLIVFLCSAVFPQSLSRPWLEGVEDDELQHFALPPIFHDLKIAKCVEDFQGEKKCVGEIFSSIWNHKITIDPGCCNLVDKVNEDCARTVFVGFTHSFFTIVLKNYCSSK
uniref:Prolamin-like domain-containing protein n=1 Tax=Manihot esculenta TaxID=3983 RepID=A0A2C9V113_MANES